MKHKLILTICMLMGLSLLSGCGGGTNPEAEVVPVTQPVEEEACYRNSHGSVEKFLEVMEVDERWHTDPVIRISADMPQDIVDAIHHVVNTINRNMDNPNLTIETGEEQSDGIIMFVYDDIGRSFVGHAYNEVEGQEIAYSTITINSNPEVRANYMGRDWDCAETSVVPSK